MEQIVMAKTHDRKLSFSHMIVPLDDEITLSFVSREKCGTHQKSGRRAEHDAILRQAPPHVKPILILTRAQVLPIS